MIFNFLGLSKDIGTQYTLYCPVVVVNMFQTMSNVILGTKIVDWAPIQPDPRFWGFKSEEQRAGTAFTICIETFDCYFLLCIALSVQRRRHPCFTPSRNQREVDFCRNSVWGIHARHSFKNIVQSVKLTVLKVFQDIFYD